uniref:Uncharacterized protein n=1 Tax=Hyaloperonospora arabidopsidis (strain Emoy2) TaxID=559515 RepID=M4B2L8_HYAAE
MTEAHSNSFFKPLGVDELSRKVLRAVFNHMAYKARGYDVERHCRARFYQRKITNPRNDDDLRVPNQVDGTSTWCLCESEAEDDSTFTRSAHRARRLPSMSALRSSASNVDVRLERKLCYEFDKTVAGHSVLVIEPYTPTPIGANSGEQVQRTHDESSNELDQLRQQMNRLDLIDSVDKRLRKVEYNLPRLDSQVDLLTKMQLAGMTSHPQAQAPSGPREKDYDMT